MSYIMLPIIMYPVLQGFLFHSRNLASRKAARRDSPHPESEIGTPGMQGNYYQYLIKN